MTIDELATEYEQQYEMLTAKIKSLTPLLHKCTGKELYELRRRIVIYEDMANDCKAVAVALKDQGKEC